MLPVIDQNKARIIRKRVAIDNRLHEPPTLQVIHQVIAAAVYMGIVEVKS